MSPPAVLILKALGQFAPSCDDWQILDRRSCAVSDDTLPLTWRSKTDTMPAIHQPSAVLFQSFDRLLFLAKGGKTVYFGDIGENSRTLLDYFESNGTRPCSDSENPAEFILEVVNKGTNDRGEDWHDVWNESQQRREATDELETIQDERRAHHEPVTNPEELSEFAMPFRAQFMIVTRRIFQQ